MRRAFEHPLAPALGCVLACAVYLLAQPATADMAAHSYRAWLFQHAGLTVWNAQWYGGHHVLGYSLLFAPLAVLLGPALLGVVAAGAPGGGFPPPARGPPPPPRPPGGPLVAVRGRRAVEPRDRPGAVPARHRARGRRLGLRAPLAGARGAAGAVRGVGEPGGRCLPGPGGGRCGRGGRRPGAAHRAPARDP